MPWKDHLLISAAVVVISITYALLAIGAVLRSEGPNHALTPGAIDPSVTQANIQQTICKPGYTATVRNVPLSEKLKVYAEYHAIPGHPKAEIDHLESLEIGGSNDIKNLWPQIYEPAVTHGAHEKDALENRLRALVCGGKIQLKEAQSCIATNWMECAKKYPQGGKDASR